MPTPQAAFTNSVQARPDSEARLRPADFGAAGEAIARGGQQFGQALEETGANLYEMQKAAAETAAQNADNVRTAQRMQFLYDGDNGLFNRQGMDAVEAARQAPAALKKIDDDVAAQYLKGNTFARKLYDQASTKRNQDDIPSIWKYANTQQRAYQKEVDGATFDLAIQNAAHATDPQAIEQNIATAGNIAVKQLLRDKNYDPALIARARQTAIGKAVAAKAEQLELQSPSEAQAFVVAHADQMDPADASKLLGALAPNAGQERAWKTIDSYVVLTSDAQQAAAPTTTNSPTGANAKPTPIPPDAALDAAQFVGPAAQEGAAAHTDVNGNLIRSPAGAAGVTQVMPATGVDPGHGVKPLQNNSREEYLRFGRDYRKALIKKYNGNIVLALTAYNWGEGNVDAQIAKVGDPRKGQISDAAFVNSIPVKEAREYAPGVLAKAGITVSGAASAEQAQSPTYQGQEINLEATINRIQNDPQLTWPDKQALIQVATQKHALGVQAQADAEKRVHESVESYMNTLNDPEQFTDIKQLPLNIRTQLEQYPDLEQAYRRQAQTNAEQIAARKKAADDAAKTASAAQADLDMATLLYAAPEKFKQIDFTDPRQVGSLSATDRAKYMGMQTSLKKSADGSTHAANYDAIRTTVRRFAGKKPPADIGLAFEEAARREEQWISQHPNQTVSDAVREGIAREVMTKYDLVTPGSLYGETRQTVRGYQLPGARAKAPNARVEVDSFEMVKAQLQQVWGRTPSDQEVENEIKNRSTGSGLRL